MVRLCYIIIVPRERGNSGWTLVISNEAQVAPLDGVMVRESTELARTADAQGFRISNKKSLKNPLGRGS